MHMHRGGAILLYQGSAAVTSLMSAAHTHISAQHLISRNDLTDGEKTAVQRFRFAIHVLLYSTFSARHAKFIPRVSTCRIQHPRRSWALYLTIPRSRVGLGTASQQEVVEPLDGLVEGLLLGELLGLLGQVAAHAEAVDDVAVQVDLVGLAGLLQDLLGLVALLGGEDLVGLGGGDGQRTRDGGQLVLVDEGGVGEVADLDAVLVVAGDVLGGEKGNVSMAEGGCSMAEIRTGRGVLTLAPKQ